VPTPANPAPVDPEPANPEPAKTPPDEKPGKPTGGGEVVPKSAPFVVRLDSSFDSDQWRALNALLANTNFHYNHHQ